MGANESDAQIVMSPEDTVVFFGHQSVGENILDGIEESESITADVFDIEINPSPEAGIVHKLIGKNEYPLEKMDDFMNTILYWPGTGDPDVVIMKLCWIDFQHNTDVDEVFSHYLKMVDTINMAKPEITVLHATVPLTTIEKSLKGWIKRIIGRPPYGYRENLVRERYNDLMREQFTTSGTLFDLATLESTKPNGDRYGMTIKDETAYALYEEYASDSGHLNQRGRSRISKDFIRFLQFFESRGA